MSGINQKEYLKKYLSIGKGSTDKKKKKRKKIKNESCGLKIIDDNVDTFNTAVQEDLLGETEDAPQIVEVIDDRPPSLRIDEKSRTHLWIPIGGDYQNSIPNSSTSTRNVDYEDISQLRRNEVNVISIPKTSVKDEDISPPRKNKTSDTYLSIKNESSEASPQLWSNIRVDHDMSPPRKNRRDEDMSPRRIRKDVDTFPLGRYEGSENLSSPKRNINAKEPLMRNIKKEDISPLRSNNVGEDISPPRRNKSGEDMSPPRRIKKNLSATRKTKRGKDMSSSLRNESIEDMSILSGNRENDDMTTTSKKHECEDMSPPRRIKKNISPPKRNSNIENMSSCSKKRDNIDEEPSPRRNNEDLKRRKVSRWDSEYSESSKMKKTLDGKTAGLQNAKDLVEETQEIKRKEEELFKNLSKEVSGVNASTIIRDKKTGKIRNLAEEAERNLEKLKKNTESEEKYSRWGKGLKQVEDAAVKRADALNEINKPLARYADDEDLERYLKEQEREGDPMLAYIRKKKKKQDVEEGKPMKPEYMGEFMPNRFAIRPGHRWDGVDRSNGYEKRWFEVQNSRLAQQEETYKWSTEDM